jgi:anti-sigma B factor antagonist
MDTLKFNITHQTDPVAVTILQVAGRLDANTETSLRERAGELFEGGARHLVIDLAEVDYISSAGLRAIFLIYKQFTPADEPSSWQPDGDVYKSAYFKLANPTPQVYSVLNLAGFLHNIPFFPTVKEALESFKQ